MLVQAVSVLFLLWNLEEMWMLDLLNSNNNAELRKPKP